MRSERLNNQKGESLIELIIVTALFAVIGTGVISILLSSTQASKIGGDYLVAKGYAEEAVHATRSVRDNNWENLVNGTHGLSTSSGAYAFLGTSDALPDGYTRSIEIADTFRTGGLTGNIAPAGVLDPKTKKVTVNVSWESFTNQFKSIASTFYLSNWSSFSWLQSLAADFTAGSHNGTDISTSGDGEVVMASMDATWASAISLFSTDLYGNGNMTAIRFDPVHNYLVTLQDSTSGDELQVFDASNTNGNTLTLLRSVGITEAVDMVVSGDYAYVAASDSGSLNAEVGIVNLLNMTTSVIDLPGSANATSIDVYGNILGIGRVNSGGSDEVVFYNIENPVAPNLLGSVDLGYTANDLGLTSTYAFVASDQNSSEVTAIDLATFMVAKTVNLPSNADADVLVARGSVIYVGTASNSSEELYSMDVSNPPAGITILNSYEAGSSVRSLSFNLQGNVLGLVLDSNSSEVELLHTSDLSLIKSFDVSGSKTIYTMALFGTKMYLGSTSNSEELQVYGAGQTGWSNPQVLDSINQSNPRPATALFIEGNYAYVGTSSGSGKDEFSIYDISNPTNITFLGSYDAGATVRDIVIVGNYAHLATESNSEEYQVINISDKSHPTHQTGLNLSGNQDATSLSISGNTLFIGRKGGSQDVSSIDITTPTSPSVLDTLNLSGNTYDVAVYGTKLYAITSDNSKEISIVNTANPSNLSLASTINLTGNQDGLSAYVYGSTLAVGRASGSDPEVELFSVSGASPVSIGSISLSGSVYGLKILPDSSLLVASSEPGAEFQKWDISNPSSPTQLAVYNVGDSVMALDESGSYMVLAVDNGSQALQIIGPATLSDFAKEAIFTSQAFDAGTVSAWDALDWTLSGNGTVVFRLRTASTEIGLQDANWVGPDGTSGSAYTVSGTSITPDPSATGLAWVQFEAHLSGDGMSTPVLEEVTASYAP